MAELIRSGGETTPAAAPWPGSHAMPRWNQGELIDAPQFTWRNWFALLGPGLLMGGAAIGGGEWLTGPAVTARYGGALMWLATLSIVAQVFYNIEISRYTLYTGEPIFTGKFRCLPGPRFWLFAYLLLDFGSVFPYLASNAATPLTAILLRRMPGPADQSLVHGLGLAVFLLAMLPLVFGGKIYEMLKRLMTFKIVTVLGFLMFMAVFHSSWRTWREIGGGFVQFGSVPVERGEDLNGNGVLDAGEDWDSDGHLDVVEPRTPAAAGQPAGFADLDGDGIRDGDNIDNLFVALLQGRALPHVDFDAIALLAAFAAIAGSGGLTNAPISNYTRDQGWGMGHHVGAIPSIVGGQQIALSHVGMVFPVTGQSLARFRRWYRHVVRDQTVVWMPACFLGVALPSMLSLQFLRRGTAASDWYAAGMTADGASAHVAQAWGQPWGAAVWYLTLLCGFLVLGPTAATTADGIVRRWVDVFWTSSPRLREWAPAQIRFLYFGVLMGYFTFGLVMLWYGKPIKLLLIATNIMNFALGFSCWHTLAINLTLLPSALRPGWFMRTGLALAGLFFMALAVVSAAKTISDLVSG